MTSNFCRSNESGSMGIWAQGPAMRGVAAALVCAAAGALGDAGLQDHPIQASGPRSSLDGGGWTAASDTLKLSIAATVPGDVITDLQRAAVIPDPYLDLTWLQNSSLWTSNPWRYTTHFDLPSSTSASAARARTADGSTVLLVFDGVKMGATVRVNGQVVGVVRDQFLRYVFPLPAASVKNFSEISSLQECPKAEYALFGSSGNDTALNPT
eukprot:m.281707 g.281707  ORF g.281707 m.281707 type:complete len:211 (-) comp16177_c0_seq1:2029-2661(-)